jgi:hypothetical protein
MSITAHRMTGGDTGIKERLQMLAPSLAAPLYPFALEGFNASVTRIVERGAGALGLSWLGAAMCLALAFAVPLIAMLAAMSLSGIDRPTAAQLRAKRMGLLAVAAPTLFTFLGVVLSMLHDPVPDTWLSISLARPCCTLHLDLARRGVAEAAASSLAVEVVPSPIENLADIERAIESLARLPNGGLVFLPDSTSIQHRDLVVVLAARHRLPAIYAFRFFVAAGGLMSYGTDIIEQYREAASYVDRILRGANPADLPVQAPTKYETVLNLKTASTLGLEVPSSLLVRADEVIE